MLWLTLEPPVHGNLHVRASQGAVSIEFSTANFRVQA